MAESSLQERLRDHAKAFDGLLSLIPAKMYYGEEVDETTGKRTKQTKAEAKEARRNKLDPDSELNKSVKEIMDEQALKKRKRDQGQVDSADDWSDVEGVEAELPGQGLKKKKQKVTAEEEKKSAAERRKEEKKAARKERKAERKELREEEAAYERRKIKSGVNKIKLGTREVRPETKASPSKPASDETPRATNEEDDDAEDASDVEEASDVDDADADADTNDMTVALAQESDDDDAVSTSPSEPGSSVFDPNGTPADSTGQAPSTTSVSSGAGTAEKPKQHKMTSDTAVLRARLAARIQSLRQDRKADGPDGKPIRTRQELIESRRQTEAKRKAHKQEVRKKAKQEEDLKREEALASARNSPGGILSPTVDLAENNFAFGRVAFGDGTKLSHDLTHELSSAKKKGPSDPKTALLKVQNEKKRLQAMDEEKRKDIAEKEAWLTARKRAEGEKIRDDEKLLKKAVKRKEQGKKKSEKAWAERSEGVQKSMKARQQKRESNIKARKEQKMLGKAGKKKKPGPTKKKSRAGFEGSFGGKKK